MKEIIINKALYILLAAVLAMPFAAVAEDEENGNGKEEGKDEEKKPKTIAELTENSERFDGYFTLFRDKKTGKTHMLIKPDQVDKEFIYWVQVANGVVEAGFFRGLYGPSFMVSVRRHFDRIEFVAENTNFYFDPDNAISRAAEANISDAILAVAKIAAEDKESGDILIKADKLFKSEALVQITPSPDPDGDPKKDFSLGKLDKDKTKILNLRSYPKNTDVEVEYVYSNPQPKVFGGPDITDSRNVSLRVMHSFIEAPVNGYKPPGGETTFVKKGFADDYDDIVKWVSPSVLFSKMIEAGQLP